MFLIGGETMNSEESYALLQSWGKVMGFRTVSQSKYMVWENQKSIRMKCYPNGTYKEQPSSCLTVFVTHEELSSFMCAKLNGETSATIRVAEVLPHGGLIPLELFEGVDYVFKGGELRINNLDALKNGRHYHIGHKIVADSIKFSKRISSPWRVYTFEKVY